jgi:uncharacterized protein (TIGR03118 family)
MRGIRGAVSRRVVASAAVAAVLTIGGGALAPGAGAYDGASATQARPVGYHDQHDHGTRYQVQNLVSDQKNKAQLQDDDLLNSWGISSSSTSALWVSDNHTGVATLYSGGIAGSPVTKSQTTRVQIAGDSPTGQVFNPTTDFALSPGNTNPALFIFATESGVISGWNPHVDPANSIPKASDPDAIYKGLTLASTPSGSRLYAANFREARVDVFDGMFQPVQLSRHAFTDPFVPRGFAPFNVQAIGDRIYVTFAKQNAEKEDETDGPGLGVAAAFTTDGRLVTHFFSHGTLNGPWGLVQAPPTFGRFANDVLVGNFGDGRIHAFDPRTGELEGTLSDQTGRPLFIENLWALRVGNTNFGGVDSIVFSAGPNDEEHGLLGTLTPTDQIAY